MTKLSDLLEQDILEQEQLEEGWLSKLLGGALTTLALSVGGYNIMQMDQQHRSDIEQAAKTDVGNKLDAMQGSEINSLYTDMEKRLDTKGDYKVTVSKKDAHKANKSKLTQAATDAKKIAILQCYSDNVNSFKLDSGKVVIDTIGGQDQARKDSIDNANSGIGDKADGNIALWLRQKFPHVAQILFNANLSNKDFSTAQKKIIADCIKAAIKRGADVDSGDVTYQDYGGDVAKIWPANNLAHAEPGSLTTILKTVSMDNSFGIATTLGRFHYQRNADGSYTVRDRYDFSKKSAYTVNPEELKDMSYVEKIAYLMKKEKISWYQAIRQIGYIENPDSKHTGKTVVVTIPADMMDGKTQQPDVRKSLTPDDKDTSKFNGKDNSKRKNDVGASPKPNGDDDKATVKKDAEPAKKDTPAEKPKSSTTVVRPSNNADRPTDKKTGTTTVVAPGNKSHTLKPVITMRNGKPHYKMKNGKPVIKLREILKDVLEELASEASC